MPVKQWADIQDDYKGGCLVLGNGASMAMHPGFSYRSLREAASNRGLLDLADPIFGAFQTSDFELVLRRLWQADSVNRLLGVDAPVVRTAYLRVREALIQTVRATHVAHADLADSAFAQPDERLLHSKKAFIAHFQLVFSLNYDLLVYWARMMDRPATRDCFKRSDDALVFDGVPAQLEDGVAYVFYPHGNLCLVRDRLGDERKLQGGAAALLEAALAAWHSEAYIPLFVSEGTSEHKMRSIRSSAYLSEAYSAIRRPSTNQALVIYGWGMGEQDEHISRALRERQPRRVAVSTYNASANQQQDLATRIQREYGVEVDLFAADSVGAWSRRSAQLGG